MNKNEGQCPVMDAVPFFMGAGVSGSDGGAMIIK